jgi:hypothetical protein
MGGSPVSSRSRGHLAHIFNSRRAKVRAACLVGFALGNKEVPGITSAYFDDICFGTKAFDFFL